MKRKKEIQKCYAQGKTEFTTKHYIPLFGYRNRATRSRGTEIMNKYVGLTKVSLMVEDTNIIFMHTNVKKEKERRPKINVLELQIKVSV